MNWNNFEAWLKEQGFVHTHGYDDLNRGWWFPEAPKNLERPPSKRKVWIHIARDQGADAYFVTTNKSSVYVESPDAAQQAVEQALIAFDLGGGIYEPMPIRSAPPRVEVEKVGPGVTIVRKPLRRDEPGWRGEYLGPQTHPLWTMSARVEKERERREKEYTTRPEPGPRQGVEYHGEHLKMRGLDGLDDGVSGACDQGSHQRCDHEACECACHQAKVCTKCGKRYDARAWTELPLVGRQAVDADDQGPAYVLELRNCRCGSTLAVET